MNAPSNRSHAQPVHANGNGGGSSGEYPSGGPHRLTPQEAALRGASLAFQKQQQQQQQQQQQGAARGIHRQTTGAGNHDGLSKQATGNGGISRQTTGSSIRPDRDGGDAAAERERERQALFLLPSATADNGKSPYLLTPGGRGGSVATDPKSASFIAATLAASRSVSPGPGRATPGGAGGGLGGGLGGGNGPGMARRSPLHEPADLRRNSTTAVDDIADTTSLAPTTSLISMFENKRQVNVDPVKKSPERSAARKAKPRSPRPQMKAEQNEDPDRKNSESKPKPKPRPSPTTKPKPQIRLRNVTPPPPVIRRADTEIVSPRPRRPETRSRLEAVAASSESNENSDTPTNKRAKATLKVLNPKAEATKDDGRIATPQTEPEDDQGSRQRTGGSPATTHLTATKTRPPAPRKNTNLSKRMPLELQSQSTRRPSAIPNTDGQEQSRITSPDDTTDARPSTADSRSSNDSFVSASSVPTRDETESLLTVGPPTPSSQTPKVRPSRPISSRPLTPAPPLRRSATGSSQLPLDSLSDAIMAGSLASARHTPVSLADSRTPPPLPPSRRQAAGKQKASSRRQSPHRMRHTLRQPMSVSDDEDARRPHHHRKGLNSKKHAHHEGSRRRWREEITEREKKRYEAVWASNRGLFLVPPPAPGPGPGTTTMGLDPDNHTRQQQQRQQQQQQQQQQRQPVVRSESYEALSEHVANVAVRDIWSRSRLPAAELAEVWDLVYGRGRPPERVVHAALNKQEFVVGMWLIDQRLRGRKIPPRVSESVWNSAKGLRVLSPDHGHGHKGKGKGR